MSKEQEILTAPAEAPLILVLMQGPPGSGKSTRAALVAKEIGPNVTICSTDDQFIVDGVYTFDPSKLFQNHLANQRKVEKELKAGRNVIVDNTNLVARDAKAYIDLAKKYGAKIRVERCTGKYQNIHGVPSDKVEQMRSKMQDLTPLIPADLRWRK